MSTTIRQTQLETKWEVVYEDDECTSIWKYNTKITTSGPVEIEYKWKRNFNPWDKKKKTLGELVKEEKKKKKSKNS